MYCFSFLGEGNKTKTGGYCIRTDKLHIQESNDLEKQYQYEPAHRTSKYLISGQNKNQCTNASEFPKPDTTKTRLQNVSVTGKQTLHRVERTYLKNAFPGSQQYELTSSRFYVKLYLMWGDICT